MMSANLFSTEGRKQQKELTQRRAWVIVISALVLLMYYPLGVFILVTRTHSYGYMSAEEKYLAAVSAVRGQIGIQQIGFAIVMVLAVLLALQGFDFLFHRAQLDFYESQPVSRKERFRNVYLNGILIFVALYAITMLVTLIIAAILGTVNTVLLLEILYEFVRIIILFFATYSVTVLAVMMTGNLPIALMMSAFLLSIEYLYAYVIQYYARIFYKTFNQTNSSVTAIGSPLYHAVDVVERVSKITGSTDGTITQALLRQMIGICFPGDMITLFVAVTVTVVAWMCYHRRKAEWAGKSIVFGPIRTLVKILIAVLAALICGILIYEFYSRGTISKNITRYAMPVVITIAAVLACGTFEAVLSFNIRAVCRKVWHIPVVIVLSLLIFGIYKNDVTGYDRYVPAVDKVGSCVMYIDGNSVSYYEDNLKTSVEAFDYYQRHMYLTNIQAVEDIVLESMDYMKTWDDSQTDYYNAIVMYRMKSGRQIVRQIMIPNSISTGLMDRVFGSDEFKKGYFQVYNDKAIAACMKNGGQLTYRTSYGSEYASGNLYQEFRENYLKDMAQFDFSFASSEPACGEVELQNFSEQNNLYTDYYVYPQYSNTIRFLQENGLYLDGSFPLDQIRSVKVTNYYPGHDLDKEKVADLNYQNSKEKEYTDSEQIREIMQNAVCFEYGDWLPNNYRNSQYTIEVYSGQRYDVVSYAFRTGEVPDFVKEDTN